MTRADLLGQIMKNYQIPIAVSGTHGKTTTTSMASHILLEGGFDPTISVGGILPAIGGNLRLGHSGTFITEACEYTNSFLSFFPKIGIILNIEEDHLDFFKNLDNIKKSFRQFAEKTTKTIVYNGDDENTVDTLKGITGKKLVSVGKNDNNEWVAKNIDVPGGFHSKYDVYHNGEFVATVHLSVPGEHNVLNSLCAFAAAYESGADVKSICEGLNAFKGAGRRFELVVKYNGITFADDYAHHPKELKVTLEAAMKMGFNRVWAVHQPFTYTRTSLLLDDFAKVLQIPDKCVISAIMGSREVNTIGIKAKDLADKVPGSVQLDTFEEITDYVLENAKPGDLVITLGCGDVYKVSRMMIKKLKEQGYEAE